MVSRREQGERGGEMSGIYIPGLKKPTVCWECPCFNDEYYLCHITEEDRTDPYNSEVPEDCPLIPVPDHGRLIDADALQWYLKDVTEILDAPTIIHADKEEQK